MKMMNDMIGREWRFIINGWYAMSKQIMDMNQVMYPEITMKLYVWSLDNKVVSEVDKILIKKGENVRIILNNNSMMRHPMHLHGHDFRLLNGQGDYSHEEHYRHHADGA